MITLPQQHRYLLLLLMVGGIGMIQLLYDYEIVMKVVIVVNNTTQRYYNTPTPQAKNNEKKNLKLLVSTTTTTSTSTSTTESDTGQFRDDAWQEERTTMLEEEEEQEEELDVDLDNNEERGTSTPSSLDSAVMEIEKVEGGGGGEEEEEVLNYERTEQQPANKPASAESQEEKNRKEEEEEATGTGTSATNTSPSCPNYGYTKGKWVKINNNDNTSDTTGGVNNNNNNNSNDKALPLPQAQQRQRQRRHRRLRRGQPQPVKPLRYTWQVQQQQEHDDDSRYYDCQLVDLTTRESFCKALNGRNLLIVGDSLNLQFYQVLKHFLRAKNIKKLSFKGRFQFMGEGTICDNGHNDRGRGHKSQQQQSQQQQHAQHQQQVLTYWRSDHLGTNTKLIGNPDPKTTYSNQPWVTKLHDGSNQVVLLNTGAHVFAKKGRLGRTSTGDDPLQEHRQSLESVQSFLESINYEGTVLFRTTPRGHIGCRYNDTEPMESETDDNWDRFFSSSSSSNNNKLLYEQYGYDIIPKQNQIYKELFPSYQLLDVARMTELRPDGHSKPGVDCLHYSQDDQHEVFRPWIWLLQNALLGNL